MNFIAVHDGFTLADLTSYSRKHNAANGEDNRDGRDGEPCATFGAEGPTDDPAIVRRITPSNSWYGAVRSIRCGRSVSLCASVLIVCSSCACRVPVVCPSCACRVSNIEVFAAGANSGSLYRH